MDKPLTFIVAVAVLALLPVQAEAGRHVALRTGPILAKRSSAKGFQLGGNFGRHCRDSASSSDDDSPRKDDSGHKDHQAECIEPLSLAAGIAWFSGTHQDPDSQEEQDLTQWTFLAGPRIAQRFGDTEKVEWFFQTLIGGVHEDLGGTTTTAAAADLAVGIDIQLGSQESSWGLGGQFDLFWINTNPGDWYPAFSLSLHYFFD